MREILFRGKAANREDYRVYRTKYKNGDWVYGLLTDADNYLGFAEMTNTGGVQGIEVDKNTIGQFTGLLDKNYKRIFEGDIVTGLFLFGLSVNAVVTFQDGAFGLEWCRGDVKTFNAFTSICNVKYEVIGNVHDNPELLKGE